MANSRRDESGAHGDRRGDREEFVGSQRVDQFVNLERRRDREMARTPNIKAKSVHLGHISRNHLRPRSHISWEQEMHNLRLKVDHLHRQLWHREHTREDRTPSTNQSSNSGENYQQRSKTLPSESFTTSSRSGGGEGHR